MIHIIGYGSMGQALAHGWSSLNPVIIHKKKLNTAYHDIEGVRSICLSTDNIFVLAVKPKDIFSVTKSLKNKIHKNNWVFSVAAGVSIKAIGDSLAHKKIVRAMPNLAAYFSKSYTALYHPKIGKQDQQYISSIWQHLGKVQWLEEESNFHAFTAIVGSGPAFFLTFAQDLQQSAINMGVTPQNAFTWTWQALNASGMMPHSFEESIKKIQSPGGTTEAGCQMWDSKVSQLQTTKILQASIKRSHELAERFNNNHDYNENKK